MQWFELGFVKTMDFMPKTVMDVYCSNLYALSWFYNGDFPFDEWEEAFDNWLRAEASKAMNISDGIQEVEDRVNSASSCQQW